MKQKDVWIVIGKWIAEKLLPNLIAGAVAFFLYTNWIQQRTEKEMKRWETLLQKQSTQDISRWQHRFDQTNRYISELKEPIVHLFNDVYNPWTANDPSNPETSWILTRPDDSHFDWERVSKALNDFLVLKEKTNTAGVEAELLSLMRKFKDTCQAILDARMIIEGKALDEKSINFIRDRKTFNLTPYEFLVVLFEDFHVAKREVIQYMIDYTEDQEKQEKL